MKTVSSQISLAVLCLVFAICSASVEADVSPAGARLHTYITNPVFISGSYLKAYDVAYAALRRIPNIPDYQREVAHYQVVIGEADKPYSHIYIVSFGLVDSKGKVSPDSPKLPHGFLGVDFFVSRSDYSVVGHSFASIR